MNMHTNRKNNENENKAQDQTNDSKQCTLLFWNTEEYREGQMTD